VGVHALPSYADPRVEMYDEFSSDYDRFMNWPARLAAELPFVELQLHKVGARRVLDAACGTGQHAIALARSGYEVVGADISAGMIERARHNAAAAGVEARFEMAGFGELSARLGTGFDALLCLGNSLPHLLTLPDLSAALADFVACLRPDGLLLVQNRNFDRVQARRERWMDPQAHREADQEWVFLRFYDFEDERMLTFNMVTLQRQTDGKWEQRVASTRLWPQRAGELLAALAEVNFGHANCYGDMQGAPFEPNSSPNLVLTARQTEEH
jgi:glycine/sarcosine N-methyltransferase